MVRRRRRLRLPSGHHRPPPQLDDAVRLAVDDDGRLCLAPPIIVKPIDRQSDDRRWSIHAACLRPLPPRSSSTTTTTTSASARTPSVPRMRSPAAAVVIAVNIIYSPSSRSCPSISSRSCGTASRRRDDATADRGHRRRRHLREGATTTTGGGRTSSSGRSASVVRRPSIPSSEIHRGADGMDRARHGRPPAAMATTEYRIVSPSTYHLLPPKNSTKPRAGGITEKP